MSMLWRLITLVVCLCLALGAQAQGGQGGFGGGGFGGQGGSVGQGPQGPQGGLGGGGAGPQGGRADFATDSEEITRQLFLTPTDRTEWTFDAREHEAIFVRITSDVFDPAVAVHDEKGAVLAENDDIEPGNQMAQLVFAAPKAGTYKVVVTNYKGTAGGAFTFHARRFLALPLEMGKSTTAMVGDRRAWVRVEIARPMDVAITVRSSMFVQPTVMRTPGLPVQNLRHLDRTVGYSRMRFFAGEPGTYFIGGFGVDHVQIRVAPVGINQVGIDSESRAALEEDEIHDWRIQVKRGDLLEVSVQGESDTLDLDVVTAQFAGGRRFYTVLEQPSMRERFLVGILADERIAFSVRSAEGRPAAYRLNVRRVGRPWPASREVSSTLDWFSHEPWILELKPGDLLKLRSNSPNYITNLRLMDPDGDVTQGTYIDRTPEVGITLPIRKAGRYTVLVGGGGVGPYRLVREIVEPRRLPEAGASGKLSSSEPEVWRFTGKPGQDLLFRIQSSEGTRPGLYILDPDGEAVGSVFEGDLLRLRPAKNGEYTLVVTPQGRPPANYTIKWVDLAR